jgi:hypothetical protein
LVVPPKPEFTNTMSEGINMEIEHISGIGMIDLGLEGQDGDSAIGIDGSIES